MLEPHIKRFFEIWEQSGLSPAYLVGGYVRNALLGLGGGDLDITSSVPPASLHMLTKRAPSEISLEERAYGLGTVAVKQRFEGRLFVYEYTAFRMDNYGRGGEHTPHSVVFTEDMGEDAARRDFTANALYMDGKGQVFDPTGRGKAALTHRRIEQVSPATLTQDALRILRMVRFCAELGFAVEPATFQSACEHVGGLADISKERIRDEFCKILMADAKYGNQDGVLDGLHALKALGAFAYIVPALLEGDGLGQNASYHAYDVFEHSLRTCACAPQDLITRLAALLHDIAKPAVWKQTGRMTGHDKLGAQMAAEALAYLRFDSATIAAVSELVRTHMFDLDNRARKKAVIRLLVRLQEEQFLRLADLREADFKGSGMGNPALSAGKWREELVSLKAQNAPLLRTQLAVNGADLMAELNIPEGKHVGELLRLLHAYALKKPTQNNYKNLIRYAKIIDTYGKR